MEQYETSIWISLYLGDKFYTLDRFLYDEDGLPLAPDAITYDFANSQFSEFLETLKDTDAASMASFLQIDPNYTIAVNNYVCSFPCYYVAPDRGLIRGERRYVGSVNFICDDPHYYFVRNDHVGLDENPPAKGKEDLLQMP